MPKAKRYSQLKFTKMHALGNDCIIFDDINQKVPQSRAIIRNLCNRHIGIGADQLILLKSSKKADFAMKIFNADGTQAEMCGNGIRCLALFIRENGLSKKKELNIETLAGIIPVKANKLKSSVDLGEPKLKGKEIPVNLSGRIINRPIKVNNKEFRITCLSVGNPHCVVFQERLDEFDIARYGPQLENLSIFPKRANVEFVDIFGRDEISMRVWERGVGETFSCGTGACAAAIACVLNGYTDRKVKVNLKGGALEVEWNKKTNHILLAGPATKVFDGEIKIQG